MKHFTIVGVLVIIVTAVVGTFIQGAMENATMVMPLASAEGAPIDWLFTLHWWAIAFLFALVVVFMLYAIVVFRRKPDDTSDGVFFHGNTALEIVWTALPLATVLYFSYLGAIILTDIIEPVEDEMRVEVIGSQWTWDFIYPDFGGVKSKELYLPLGRTIHFEMRTPDSDVIHSFWVPEFRAKQDVVPGMTTHLRLTPTKLGEYTLRCAELCGLEHAYMNSTVKVIEPEEFETWVLAQAEALTEAPSVEKGEELSATCFACHSIDGSPGVGPSWQGLYGSERTLEDGSTVTADDEYLKRAMLEPGVEVVDGFANAMPVQTLSDNEVASIIEYIKTLQ